MDQSRPTRRKAGSEASSPAKSLSSPDKFKASPSKTRVSPAKAKANCDQDEAVPIDADNPDDSINRCHVKENAIDFTAYVKYPGNYWNRDEEFHAKKFRENFKAHIHHYRKGLDLEIDLIGLAPAVANAYRRIMIAEVPTMAIEHCFIYQNTSVIQDEMLAHRLGMIPIRVDPTKFDLKPRDLALEDTSERFSIVFELKVKCERLKLETDTTGRREELHKNYKIHSRDLKWKPLQNQAERFAGKDIIRPVYGDILIAKLADKQEIDLKVHAVKGIGQDHAKFSPVATATYRLMPDIQLKEKIVLKDALKLQKSFSKGVIEISGPDDEAKVVNSRLDTGSRNVFRHAKLKDKVKYDLIKDHFIFRIESTGAIPAIDILLQSCDILESKCDVFLKELQLSRQGMDQSASMVECI